ncbi:hypothetical protein [Eisenbergiella massiliensis]|uniref:hypothetical protein n=1 Tax=Eisenbergiella massiliensis TaxID=1720294 RepID=UPI00399B8302
MQVVTVKTSTGQTWYCLANDDGSPVEPVLQYGRTGGRKPLSSKRIRYSPAAAI